MNIFWIRYRELIGYWLGMTLTLAALAAFVWGCFWAGSLIVDAVSLKRQVSELTEVLNGHLTMVDKSGREVYARIEWKEVSK